MEADIFTRKPSSGYSWWGAVMGELNGFHFLCPPWALESVNQAAHHNRSNFGRCLMYSGHFQAVLFYSPELSHESTTKPRPEPQIISPPEGNWGGGGVLKEPTSWAAGTLALHGVWPDHLSLALPAPHGHRVTATLISLPGKERKVTPDRCKRTLKTECGSF